MSYSRKARVPLGGVSDAMRRTDNLQSLTTRDLRLLNTDGSYPVPNSMFYTGDTIGHVDFSTASLTGDGHLTLPGSLTTTGDITITSPPPVSSGGNDVLSYNAGTGVVELQPSGGGGSSVVSVSAGSSNMNVAPTTGAVVVDLSSNLTIAGRMTAGDLSGGSLHLPTLATGTNTEFLSITATGAVQKQTGVSSVSAGSSNVRVIPTTGSVVVDLSSNLTITGRMTAGDLSGGSLHLPTLATGTNTEFLSITATGAVQKQTISTGSGVSSVAAGASGNLSVNPTTGPVVVDLSNNVSVAGTLTSTNLVMPSTVPSPTLVVGGSLGPTLLYSTNNGASWTTGINQFSQGCFGLAYGNGMWVAVGRESGGGGGPTIKYSTNGINWNNVASNLFTNLGNDVAYGNGRWVAVGGDLPEGGANIKYSTDGINWITAGGSLFSGIGVGVAYGGGNNWVAVGGTAGAGGAGKTIKYSTDNGSTWIDANSGAFPNGVGAGYEVAYGNGRWIAVGQGNSDGKTIKYSTNGTDWIDATSGTFPGSTSGNAIAYGGGRWIAGGISSPAIRYSDDNGLTWTPVSGGGAFSNYCFDMAYYGGVWYSAGGDVPANANGIRYSTDGGITWTPTTAGTFPNDSGRAISIVNVGVSLSTLSLTSGASTSSITVDPFTGTSVVVKPNSGEIRLTRKDISVGEYLILQQGNDANSYIRTQGSGSLHLGTETANTVIVSPSLVSIAKDIRMIPTPTKGATIRYINNVGEEVADQIIDSAGLFIIAGRSISLSTTTPPYTDGSSTTKMYITNTGDVGIGTMSPAFKLDVTGNARITGTLTKGGGSFEIDHPIVPNTKLVHSFIEGPRCDLIYRGRKELSAGVATVDIEKESTANGSEMSPGTFAALCTNPQVYLQNNATFDRVVGSVSGNLLTIRCENTESNAIIDWMVVAERHDPFIKTWNRTDENGLLVVEHTDVEA